MVRRIFAGIATTVAVCAGLASTASASTPIRLYLDQGAAFQVLGHSCGGIQENVYVRGFAPSGYPQGSVELSTSCGGSGRGGGYKVTKYTGSADVVWTWFGETRSYSKPGGPMEALEATDEYGDRVYNVGTAAYLETGSPPLQPPAAPTITGAAVLLNDATNQLQMNVSWTVAAETAGLLNSETVTATPLDNPKAVVLSTTVSPYFSSAVLAPVEPSTTYSVTVTTTDSEGTSPPSAPLEIRSPNSDGEAEKTHNTTEACTINHGKITLTPGLTETPAIQTIGVSGELSGCNGPQGFEGGKYTAKLVTTEEVTCAALSGASLNGTAAKSFAVKWLPLEEGSSKGTLVLPISEAPLTGFTGTLSGGPFPAATNFKAESISEAFKGASLCGVPQGKLQVVKPLKAGVFTTSEVVFG